MQYNLSFMFRYLLILGASMVLFQCLNDNEDELEDETREVTAKFVELEHNPLWYRTFDTTSFFNEADGELLFSWYLEDETKVPDSFYIGIDTLWHLPPKIYGGGSSNKWDLQVCPDEVCIQGVNIDVFGGNARGTFNDTDGYHGEHHFQFIPAVNPDPAANYGNIAPEGTIVGGMMYANSRTTGLGDTVFAFGAWQMPWDEDFLPPVKPVDGYLPKLSDFKIVEGKVQYHAP